MDVAIQFPVQESTLSLSTQPKSKVPVFTKHILRIGNTQEVPEHDYIHETLYFTNVSLKDALKSLQTNEAFDCLLVSVDKVSADLVQLKEIAKDKAVPFILFTSKFDQKSKDLALKLGADEYHYGALSYPLLKRIEFIKKLKKYKNERGDKPYVFQRVSEEVPKIKLWTLKRSFDIAIALTGLMLLLPLLTIIAVLIKLESKGPIFYISKRAGAGYKIFDFYKFRSMRTGADKELQKMAHLNQYNDGNNVFFKFKNDPRITRVGSFIRNTSLDELPQLINVLKGDMSLVGNRPLPLYEAEKLTKDQIAWRFLAPAGITGLWQVTKRGKAGEMSPEERIALDMEYAMKNSFWLDMKILFSTVPALLQKEQV